MVRRLVRTISALAVVAGAVVLMVVAHQVWGTGVAGDRAQDRVADELREDWAVPGGPVPPAPGAAFAFLHVPRLGEDWTRAVVEGVEPEQLEAGPGHYPGTAQPGEVGNFAVAGHRVGQGSPFLDLDSLQRGDAVVVETAGTWHVYRVTTTTVVAPTETWVVAPTPGGPPGARPPAPSSR
ncbi:MAG TPA: class E sortase [Geodermatophilus sp.]|nr:class E sortase [Geodermatophilus sp.]